MMANGFFNFQQSFPGNIFVIRIILPTGEATDWRIESEISFHDVLVSYPNNTCFKFLFYLS